MQKHVWILCLLCILPWFGHAQETQTIENVTSLKAAMALAGEKHPELMMSALDIEAAEDQLMEQQAYAYNPELSLEPQRRRLAGGGRSTDYYIGLSQSIEFGGKRGYREQLAQAEIDVSRRQGEGLRKSLMIAAANAFVELYFARQLVDLRHQQSVSLQQLSKGVQRKLELGSSNMLDVNLARASLASSLSAENAAQQSLMLAQAQYAMSLGMMHLEPKGLSLDLYLPTLDVNWRVPADAERIALQSRSEITSLQAQLTASRSNSDLAKAQRVPDPTISLMGGREAGDQLIKLGISFPIPVLNSHQGAYRAALVQTSRKESELLWQQQRLRLQVQATLANYRRASEAVRYVQQHQSEQQAVDSMKLAQKAFDAGELDLEELVIHINQSLDARLTTLNILKQGWLARIRLAEVLGHPEYITQGLKP